VSPQLTVTEEMYRDALTKAKNARDKALIEVLWSTGLRRSEIARLEVGDINLSQGYLIIRTTKAGKPRIAPLSPHARRALLRLVGKRLDGSVFELNSSSIRVRLARLGLPSAHAWRRGWAVHALRNGISEASVRAAAGWSSGAMVVRYTSSLSGELALEEFQRVWQPKHP
jgi:integrase/recombinase XerD